MKRNPLVNLFLLLTLAALNAFAAAQDRQLITSPIDNSVRTVVATSTHPLIRVAADRGAIDPAIAMNRMVLVLGASPAQELALRTFLDAQQTRGSAEFHHWLTPAEFAQRFGPAPADLQKVQIWLQQQGFKIDSVARGGRWIEFSGSAQQVRQAFQTAMHQYSLAGETHIANAGDISIPAALAPVVRGVLSLNNFFSKPLHSKLVQLAPAANGKFKVMSPSATFPNPQGGQIFALSPGDFANIYNLKPLYTASNIGTGESIAVVARSNIDPNDPLEFQQSFGLPLNPPSVSLNGPDPGFNPFNGDAVEATLDTEWAGAVAPAATVDVVVSSSTVTTDGVDLSAAYIVDNDLAPVMSTSFGQCEKFLGAAGNAFYNSLWQQAAAEGISAFVSAGDNGAAACDDPNDPANLPAQNGLAVSGLASTPFNTAVGGTMFNPADNTATFWNSTNSPTFVSAKGYIPEVAWNESCTPAQCGGFFSLFAGSGGVSTIYSKPSWQAGSGVPSDGHRDIPDVSLTAAGGDDPYLLCFAESCNPTTPGGASFFGVGGTSVSSPAFAGIMAVADEALGQRQGLAGYALYSIASTENFAGCNSSSQTNPAVRSACVFNDVTSGNTNIPGQTGFTAKQGFDLATGLGSVDASNLVSKWQTFENNFQGTTTSLTGPNPITGTHGQPVSLTVTVSSQSRSGTPSGSIALLLMGGPLAGIASHTISGSGGAATTGAFSVNNLPGGNYTVSAHYPGDGTFGPSDSAALSVNISPEASTDSLTSFVFNANGNPTPGTSAPYGPSLVLRDVVAGVSGNGFATGTVTFNEGGKQLGQLSLNNLGQAELENCINPVSSPVCLTVGSHTISTSYSGDSSFNASSSSAVTVTITKATPPIVVGTVSGSTSVTLGTPTQLQAFVVNTGTILPTGTVQFFDGTTAISQPVQLDTSSPPQATITTTFTNAGTHNITVKYSGDSTYNAETSSPATQIMVVGPFQLTAIAAAQTVAAGGTATYSVSVMNNGFAGKVNFSCTGAPAGVTCSVAPNPLTLTAASSGGTVTVTAATTQQAKNAPMPFSGAPVVFAGIFAGVLFLGGKKRKRLLLQMMGALALVISAGMMTGCGGHSNPPPAPTTATMTLTGSAGTFSTSIPLTLTITH